MLDGERLDFVAVRPSITAASVRRHRCSGLDGTTIERASVCIFVASLTLDQSISCYDEG